MFCGSVILKSRINTCFDMVFHFGAVMNKIGTIPLVFFRSCYIKTKMYYAAIMCMFHFYLFFSGCSAALGGESRPGIFSVVL